MTDSVSCSGPSPWGSNGPGPVGVKRVCGLAGVAASRIRYGCVPAALDAAGAAFRCDPMVKLKGQERAIYWRGTGNRENI